jgi:hypothetical protein
MTNPSTPCGRVTPETALRLFQGWPAHRAGGVRPSSTPLDTLRRTPMPSTLVHVFVEDVATFFVALFSGVCPGMIRSDLGVVHVIVGAPVGVVAASPLDHVPRYVFILATSV